MAQTAVLGLDANPKNRCESTGAGSLWTLHNLQTVTITVTLQRFTGMDANPQTIVKVVGAGRYVGQQ